MAAQGTQVAEGGIVSAAGMTDKTYDRNGALQDRVDYFINNPDRYTDYTYKYDPQAYLAVNVYKAFQDTYGRAPTKNEYNLYGDVQRSGGNVASEVAKAYASDPQVIARQKQSDLDKLAPGFNAEVGKQFQGILGRTPDEAELKHFSSLLASGATDSYGLQTFLKQQPEYQKTQTQNFQNQLSDQLAGYDKQYFQNNILPSLQETYAKQGRSFDSSGFQNATANAAQQQNIERQKYIAGIGVGQYQNSQAQAYTDYANQVQQVQNIQNGSFANSQNAIARVGALDDYTRQQDAYNQYLSKYGKRSPMSGAIAGATTGAAAGSYFGPYGTAIGGVVGGIGGYLGSNGGSF